jgi:protein subunit release factor B
MPRELLFSVTKDDFRIDYFRAPGNGGQKVNKTSSACRITHIESGAVGQAVDHREQHRNRQEAFRRCVESDKFKLWHKIKTAEVMLKKQGLDSLEKQVDKSMNEKNLKVEVFNKQEQKWQSEIIEIV